MKNIISRLILPRKTWVLAALATVPAALCVNLIPAQSAPMSHHLLLKADRAGQAHVVQVAKKSARTLRAEARLRRLIRQMKADRRKIRRLQQAVRRENTRLRRYGY